MAILSERSFLDSAEFLNYENDDNDENEDRPVAESRIRPGPLNFKWMKSVCRFVKVV